MTKKDRIEIKRQREESYKQYQNDLKENRKKAFLDELYNDKSYKASLKKKNIGDYIERDFINSIQNPF